MSSVFLLSPLPAAPAAAAAAAQEAADRLPADDCSGRHDDEQGKARVQAVILEPIKVTGRQPQVWRPAMPHHKLHPEDGGIQGRHGPVVVQSGQALHAGLVT